MIFSDLIVNYDNLPRIDNWHHLKLPLIYILPFVVASPALLSFSNFKNFVFKKWCGHPCIDYTFINYSFNTGPCLPQTSAFTISPMITDVQRLVFWCSQLQAQPRFRYKFVFRVNPFLKYGKITFTLHGPTQATQTMPGLTQTPQATQTPQTMPSEYVDFLC